MVLSKIKTFFNMIKFEHTIFALPFAYMGMFLGSEEAFGTLPTWWHFLWITLAMVGARSAAMALNRLIDRTIDKLNPRTANREIPAGKLKIVDAIIFVIISMALFIYATLQLSDLAIKLLPIAVFMLVIYSYTKRFTWGCHLVLGAADALAPLGAWIAVTNNISFPSIILFLTITFWIAGFDIIYATQDMDFDKKNGLKSIPVRFGLKNSLIIARVMHGLTIVGLIYLLFITSLSWWYLIGVVIANFILHYEHSIISPKDMSRLNMAFFTMNGVLSVIVFVFTFIDLVI